MLQEISGQTLDVEDLLTRCLGNAEFAERVLAKFQERSEQDLIELEEAITTGDTTKVGNLAHRLKGASANVSALGLQMLAAKMEQDIHQDSTEEILADLADLKEEWNRFTSQAPSLIASTKPTPEV